MADGIYNLAKQGIMSAAHNFSSTGDDWGLVLCMTNHSLTATATLGTAASLPDLSMDEYDGAGYTRPTIAASDVTLTTATDSTSVYVDFPDVVFSTLGSGGTGTRGIGAVLLYESNSASGNDSANIPIAVYDITDVSANGGNLTIQWAAASDGGALTLA